MFTMKSLKLQVYCCLLFLLLNYPLISLFNQPRRIMGVPVLYAYLFGVWMLFIVVLFFVVEREHKTDLDTYE